MDMQADRPMQPAHEQGAPIEPVTAILVGHNGHPGSDAALAVASNLARQLGAHLHVVHSVTVDDFGIDPDIDEFETEGARNLAREKDSIAAALRDSAVSWTYHEERGDPARQLAALADAVHAGLIVVGAHHRHAIRHLLDGGPIPERLIHHQPRPVLVVPSPPAAGR